MGSIRDRRTDGRGATLNTPPPPRGRIIYGDGGCRWLQPTGNGRLTAQFGWLVLRVGRRLVLSLHSLNEPGELSHWPCHDDSTTNIAFGIIITIICTTVVPHPQETLHSGPDFYTKWLSVVLVLILILA